MLRKEFVMDNREYIFYLNTIAQFIPCDVRQSYGKDLNGKTKNEVF